MEIPRTPIIIIKVLGAADGYWDPTPRSTVKGLLCKIDDLDTEAVNQSVVVIEGKTDRVITVHNFRNNLPVRGQYYICYNYGNGYILDNQAAFMEYA